MSTLIFITPSDDEVLESPAYMILHEAVDFANGRLDVSNNSYFDAAGTYALFDVADCSSVLNVSSLVVTPRPGRTAGVPFRYLDLVCVTMT